MDEEKKRCSLGRQGKRVHQMYSFMWADNFWIMSHSKEFLEQILKDPIEEASKLDLERKE